MEERGNGGGRKRKWGKIGNGGERGNGEKYEMGGGEKEMGGGEKEEMGGEKEEMGGGER